MSRWLRLVAGTAVALLMGAGCSSVEEASVTSGDAAAWTEYRDQVVPILERVLGPSADIEDDCADLASSAPEPRFGIDVGPTLANCADGDTSNARLVAHQQVDLVATNDAALADD